MVEILRAQEKRGRNERGWVTEGEGDVAARDFGGGHNDDAD